MAPEIYTLEHFYYGQLLKEGRPEKELQLLAASPGVKPEHIAEAVKVALMPPLPGKGAWTLVRGKTALPFVLVQSQQGGAEQTTLHYILVSPDALRAMGGNVKSLMALVEETMPTFDQPGQVLKPLALGEAAPHTTQVLMDDILRLMDYTHNKIDIIDSLLAAIVLAVPLAVSGAPADIETRVAFIEGLLAFLPPSARFGVTYSTHTLHSTKTDAQIRFYPPGKLPSDALCYNWADGRLGGKEVENDYSRFITSQLRLDTELVIKQTRELTAMAAWRIRRGDSLAEALAYASYRLKVDDALVNNQPVESDDVSKVLAEDPTLSEELRVKYGRHLMAFALALGDMKPAEPISTMLRQQPALETAVQAQLGEALTDGKANLVYTTLARWLANPLGPVGKSWVELTHKAALAHMDALVKARDLKNVNQFLETIHKADAGIEISRVVPKLIEQALPLSILDKSLNEILFYLAIDYLDGDTLKRILSSAKFTGQLPQNLVRLTPYLNGDDVGMAPAGLVADTAAAFGDQWQDLVLIRLAEVSMLAKRPDLVDSSALHGLWKVLDTPQGVQYSQTLAWIARNLDSDDILEALDEPAPRYILQILLSKGAYTELAREMLHQARLLYPGDLQTVYLGAVRQVFAETNVKPDEMIKALDTIAENGIKSLPLLTAYMGALEGRESAEALEPVAIAIMEMIDKTPAVLDMVHPAALMAVLKFYIQRRDVKNTIKVSELVATVAANEGSKGIGIVARMYRMLDWDESVRASGLNLLRRFVREAKDEDSRKAVAFFGKELGAQVQQALETTYTLKKLMGGVTLLDYAEFIHTTAEFLFSTALPYADSKHLPTIGALMNNFDSMTGGVNDDGRRTIAQEIIGLGKALVVLGDHQAAAKVRDMDKHIDSLLNGKSNPQSALDVWWIMGGYLTRGKRYPLRLTTEGVAHPLGERSAPILKDETELINDLLRSAVRAFPPDKKVTLTAEDIRGEMDYLWGTISLHDQREIVRDLAVDLQRVAELVAHIATKGTAKAMEDGSSQARKLEQGKTQPQNTLEFYRVTSAYFKSRAN